MIGHGIRIILCIYPKLISSLTTMCTINSMVVVLIHHPERNREKLEDVEGVQDLLYKKNMVGLHWDIQRVGAIMEESVGGAHFSSLTAYGKGQYKVYVPYAHNTIQYTKILLSDNQLAELS